MYSFLLFFNRFIALLDLTHSFDIFVAFDKFYSVDNFQIIDLKISFPRAHQSLGHHKMAKDKMNSPKWKTLFLLTSYMFTEKQSILRRFSNDTHIYALGNKVDQSPGSGTVCISAQQVTLEREYMFSWT